MPQLPNSDFAAWCLTLYTTTDAHCRKKYFSSTERLHIAQQCAAEKRRKHSLGSGSMMSVSTSTDPERRPSTSQGITIRKKSSRRQPKDCMPAVAGLDVENISEEQALWFVALPDKIRRRQFTRKEQISLAVRCKRALQDSSPELADEVLRRCLYAGREGDAVSTRSRKRRSSATVDTDILVDDDFLEYDAFSKKSLETVDPDVDAYYMYSRPTSSEAKDETSIPPSPARPMHKLSTFPRQTRSRSSSRSSSLMPIPLPPPGLSDVPPVPPLPPPDQLPLPRHRILATASSLPQLIGPTTDSQECSVEANTYQHDVRKQLRQYLSPQKFDEAIEFGFAFNDEPGPSLSTTSKSFPVRPPPPCLIDDEYGDEDSYDSAETMSPRTPTESSDTALPAIRRPSFDSSMEIRPNLFTTLKTGKTRSPDGSLGNREMTIHMTLTRRDLRAPDENIYGVQRPTTSGVDVERVDPLALDILPVCDDPSGAHGVFAVRDSKGSKGLRKVWKSIRGH